MAAASSGQVYTANGAGSGVWTTPTPVVFPNKHIAGLTWSNAADASNDITVLAGTCRDSTNTEDMTLSAAITKRIDAAWAVGDNQGGFDTGSVLATGVYHLFLIKRTDTGVVDVAFSATLSGPTFGANIPAAYTKFRRIGSFYRQSSVNSALTVIEIEGGGIECIRNTPVVGSAGGASNTGTTHTLAQFPNNSSGLEAIFGWHSTTTTSSDSYVVFSPTTQTFGDLNSTVYNFATVITTPDSGGDNITYRVGGYGRCAANSAQIKFYSFNNSLTITPVTLGWKDPRR